MLITREDGLITREEAAALCGVSPDAVSQWISRGYGPKERRARLPVAKREGRTVLLDPVEVAKADHATKYRARRAPARPLATVPEHGIQASGIDPRQLRGRAAA